VLLRASGAKMLQISDENKTSPVQIVAGWIGPRSQAANRRYIPWFTPEGYRRFRAILKDPVDQPMEHDKWLKICEAEERYWMRQGVTILRVRVSPEAFSAWCRRRFVKPNSKAVEVFIEDMIYRSDSRPLRA